MRRRPACLDAKLGSAAARAPEFESRNPESRIPESLVPVSA